VNLRQHSLPSLYSLKASFCRELRPLTLFLAERGTTPNQVTAASIMLSLAAGLVLALWPQQPVLLLLPAILALRMTLNAVDGELARVARKQTRVGLVLNEFERSFSDAVLYLPLALVPGVSPAFAVLVVVATLMRESMHTAVTTAGVDRGEWPMAKPDRALAMGAIALAMGLGVPPGTWLDGALALVASLITAPVLLTLTRLLRESS
jgi:CDP-diacylglycerol--glycerol-3-phosphate 3-phosphatidyltransferase